MQRKIINFLLLFCAAAFISSCKKDLNNDYQNHQEYYTLEAFAKQIGVHPNSIKEFKDFFVVGGDMVFNKRDFQKTSLRQVVVGQTASSNVFGPISLENQRDINIYIDTVARYLPASYTSKFVYSLWAAIENFNTLIPNSYIRMTQVLDSNLADIKIHLVDGLPAPFTYSDGYTLYPVNGKPGSDMWLDLNKAHDNYYPTVAGLTCLTTHELGHAIGLFHTNEIPNDPNQIGTFLKQIPGTPGFASFSNPNPDQYSFIISPGFSIPEWTESTSEPTGNGFSEYDKIAIEYLYPAMYAKVRKVLTNTHYYNQGYYELQLFDLYIEFFADPGCTIPRTTHIPETVTVKTTITENSSSPTYIGYTNHTIPPGVSSYKIGSDITNYISWDSGYQPESFLYDSYALHSTPRGIRAIN